MSSPVSLPFQSFIKIDRAKKEALYLQIVYQFINAVKNNLLEENDRLPGSRIIAQNLQIHRKTIVAALAELQDQGWIKIVPNVGTFVQNPERSSIHTLDVKPFRSPPLAAPFDFRTAFILDTPVENNEDELYFTDGIPDYRIIKSEELARFYTSVLRRKSSNEAERSLFFRDQLSYYLNATRSFHISREFLLPVAGLEKVYSILAHLLINKGDVVLVEELSYFLPNMIYSQAGACLKTIPLDEEGMNIGYIRQHFKPGEIRVVNINTRCHYPTGIALSERRKEELLKLAEEYNFVVIENDTDFEFSNLKIKKGTLLSKNGGDRIIYIGAFGRFLNPGFQMNFILGPKDLLEEAIKYLNIFGKPDFMMEKALGELIHEGDIHRYQRKASKVTAERKETFAQLLDNHFKNQISFTVPVSGLAFWINFNRPISLTLLQKKVKEKGLFIPRMCLYQNKSITALRLGFAHLNSNEMEEAVKLLSAAYFEVIEQK